MSNLLCSVCGSPLRQIHRRTFDRLINQFYRVHRYRCLNSECQWTGLLHSKRHKAKKKEPRWCVWVLLVFLGVATGVALFEHLSAPPKISTDVATSP